MVPIHGIFECILIFWSLNVIKFDLIHFLSNGSQVLMFPVLLDDRCLFTEFEKFIEAVDNMHELALAGQQQFPVFSW